MNEKKKGPTRAQLEEQVRRLAQQNAELLRRLLPDPVRRPGEHWYELVSLFDPAEIRTIKAAKRGGDRVHVLGTLAGMVIVEFPRGAGLEAVHSLMQKLTAQGAGPVFAVQEGVRFVRLRALDPDEERQIDEEVQRDEKGPSGARPELHGDGVGSDLPDGGSARDGGDRHGEGQGEGALDRGGG